MAKRPLGLAKSKKSKKAKVEENGATNEDDDQQKAQIELDVDPEDELGQLVALYDAYLKSDEAGGEKILHGVVHESDRLLREAADKKETDKLPAKFHSIYSLALLGLAKFADLVADDKTKKDTTEQFVEAAIERAETGLETYADDSELLFSYSKALVTLVATRMKVGALKDGKAKKLYKIAVSQKKTLVKAVEQFERAEDKCETYGPSEMETLESILEISQGFESLEESKAAGELDVDYSTWVKKRWEVVVAANGDEKVVKKAHKGLGEYYLEIGSELLPDDEEEEEDEENEAKARDALAKAVEHLTQGEDEKDSDGSIHPMIAEAQIELANLLEDGSEEQEKLYKGAVFRLKKAQRMGLGDFTEQIAELTEG